MWFIPGQLEDITNNVTTGGQKGYTMRDCATDLGGARLHRHGLG